MKTRRDFLQSLTLALTAGLVTGCAWLLVWDVYEIPAEISDPHGHEGGITKEAMTSIKRLEINIQGTSNHIHTVTLSAEGLHRIIAGEKMTFESTVYGAHTHMVTFNA